MTIVRRTKLSPDELNDVRQLLQTCEKHDGIHLELSLNLSMHDQDEGSTRYDFLFYEGDDLQGYLASYAIVDPKHLEMGGMVAPERRREGIFRSLLQAAAETFRENGIQEVLLVVENTSEEGKAMAESLRFPLSHSEYMLKHSGSEPETADDHVQLDLASEEDVPALTSIHAKAFDDSEEEAATVIDHNMASSSYDVFVARLDSEIIGSVSVMNNHPNYFLSAFSIDPVLQGQGLGGQVLRQTVARLLLRDGAMVMIEVEVDNRHALKLYQNSGFEIVMGHDYYRFGFEEF
ncbi:GNAT family N-acetyltransferase [Halobacillus fulvus]|nr:GNAT family N-acetyltransferase [Halobacillus fulvus]